MQHWIVPVHRLHEVTVAYRWLFQGEFFDSMIRR